VLTKLFSAADSAWWWRDRNQRGDDASMAANGTRQSTVTVRALRSSFLPLGFGRPNLAVAITDPLRLPIYRPTEFRGIFLLIAKYLQ
jgi:hypothetical protein